MYTSKDSERFFEESENEFPEEYRSDWRKDYARILHSPSFRRLQGKTQLFPAFESDFFRNRLTHSLEVAQVAKSIAMKINRECLEGRPETDKIDLDLMEIAGLAHDLGHPPFGHQGEEALDRCMYEHGGFEGNAQTLRILSKLEKKVRDNEAQSKDSESNRFGLNLTYRALASILKYDNKIPEKRVEEGNEIKLSKGYYLMESDLVDEIKKHVLNEQEYSEIFKTIECQIMDIADDIAYSTYDIEDAFKAGFLTPFDIIFAEDKFYSEVIKSVSRALASDIERGEINIISINDIKDVLFNTFQELFNGDIESDTVDASAESVEMSKFLETQVAYKTSKKIASDGYLRTKFTSNLIKEALNAINFEYNEDIPAMSRVWLEPANKLKVEILKKVAFQSQVLSPKLKIAEYRGKEIVEKIFDTLMQPKGYELLPEDYRGLFEVDKADNFKSRRIICDYIASMTDKYAIEFYGRLTSENPETIFKPY